MRHRQVSRDNTGFQARAKERVEDHLANTADLAQTAQQQQRRLQYLAVHDRMGLGLVPQIADLLGDDTAQQRKAQVRAHGLCNTDPVVTRRALHRLIALVNDHADGLVVRRHQRLSACIMAVPSPIRAARNADRVDAQPIACRLDQIGSSLRIKALFFIRRLPILQ